MLDDGGTIVTESAAVCMHLAEKFPESRLLPPAATIERTQCYTWVSFILTELDAPLWAAAGHRFALPRERRVPAAIDTACWSFAVAAERLAQAVNGHAYLVGDSFSIVDILAAHTLLWAKSTRIPLGSETLERYLENLTTREAFGRAQRVAAGAQSPIRSPPPEY